MAHLDAPESHTGEAGRPQLAARSGRVAEGVPGDVPDRGNDPDRAQGNSGAGHAENGTARFVLGNRVGSGPGHGEQALRSVTLVEGWTFAQFRTALAKADGLQHETSSLTDDELMTRLGRPGLMPEGRFYPDTYTYGKDSADVRILQRALRAMDRQLALAWKQRSNDSQLQTADAALILASIVEKETGKAEERRLIAGLYTNRLRIGMRLQADPTVIYPVTKGKPLGRRILKSELRAKNGYNTYAMAGLPIGPITNPGRASIEAVLNPASTKDLFFVADGTGGHAFARTLAEHNENVARWRAIERERGEEGATGVQE